MIRILFEYLLPFILPALVYFGWIVATRRRAEAAAAGTAPRWHDAPWIWLAGAGLLLTAIVLFAGALFGNDSPTGHYEPPRLIDGEIQPGRVR